MSTSSSLLDTQSYRVWRTIPAPLAISLMRVPRTPYFRKHARADSRMRCRVADSGLSVVRSRVTPRSYGRAAGDHCALAGGAAVAVLVLHHDFDEFGSPATAQRLGAKRERG